MSAIDMGRIWERALRRADLPIAYSEGFTPHPKVSFPDALTLGYASTGEYAELTFDNSFTLDPAMRALSAAMPAGMSVEAWTTVAEGAPRLAKWLRASLWDLAYPTLEEGVLLDATRRVMAEDVVTVGRDRKGEITEVDLRPALAHLRASGTTVRAVVHHTEPPMRPQEIHLALSGALSAGRVGPPAPHAPPGDDAGHPIPEPALVTRVAQGIPTDDGLTEAIDGAPLPAVPPARQKATNP